MISLYLFIFFTVFLFGVVSLMIKRENLLMILLSMEFSMLGLLMFLFNLMLMFIGEIYFVVIFVVFMVIDSVLGLTILIFMIRLYGNDYFFGFNLLEC
uniref:NADH-ubiquinone oxidoreductase chain 4L n=1 Tax=Pseudoneureclipsis sibuyana TaxID=2904893 RepID=A0A9E8RT94_9NEOP|nr:NADH dehydrogenase subunit 4L [Pseudoneureclipsis sibuyana]UZZ44297.1 NADH dehydrogenase subunit 4L [Pseudoneureclipsis sibuyana]